VQSSSEYQPMKHSNHGITKNDKAEEQPADKERTQIAHMSDPKRSVSHEATRASKRGRNQQDDGPRDDAAQTRRPDDF
jgi:hypothetical protein